MPKYRVHGQAQTGFTIDVDVDVVITPENEEEATQEIMDAAFQEGVSGLCHQCSGGGFHKWTRDEGEMEEVFDKDGKPEIMLLEG